MIFAAFPPRPMTRDSSADPKLIGPPSMLSDTMLMQHSSSSTESSASSSSSFEATRTTTLGNTQRKNMFPKNPRMLRQQQEHEEKVLHPPRSNALTTLTATNHHKLEDASFLFSFSATVSEEDDNDSAVLPKAPANATLSCLYGAYCGALNCWGTNSAMESTAGMSRYGQLPQPQQREETQLHETASITTSYSDVRCKVNAPPRITPRPQSCEDALTKSSELDLTVFWQDDPVLQARHSSGDLLLTTCGDDTTRRVRFATQPPVVHEYPAVPPHVLQDLFWSDVDGYELRHERRALLQQFKRHISYAPLVPWTEHTDSIRGLEDHYAEMIGRTSSHYIRKRHEELVLREYGRLRYSAERMARLATIAEQSAEDERDRALEMARLDECMAKEEGTEGATTSPVGAPLFTSGEAFLHTLMVRLRDYT